MYMMTRFIEFDLSEVLYSVLFFICGLGSSVGIATELRAGRSGMESRLGRDFPSTQPELTQPPIKFFLGGKGRPGRAADHSHLSSAAVMEV